MTYTSEIEKLEKRWAENPKGRNFAPLADAYRKAGELDRALELCKNGLALHPDYVSAHIVYGRCLIDQKNAAGATEVFRKVLELDHENVLALKILAEIAERGGRFDEAVDWLTRLLKADPMNSEAPEALARAKAKANQAGPSAAAAPPVAAAARVAPQAAAAAPVTLKTAAHPGAPAAKQPVVRLVPETRVEPRVAARPERASAPAPSVSEATTSPIQKPDFAIEQEPEPPKPPTAREKGAGAGVGIETFDGAIDFNSVAHTAAKAEGLEVEEEIDLKPQNLVVEGLAATQFESGMFTVPPPPAPRAPTSAASAPPPTVDEEPLNLDLPTIDLPLIMPDELPPPSAATPPAAARTERPLRAGAPPQPRVPAPPPPPPLRPQAPVPGVAAAVALSDDDGAADTAALSRAEPVLTETMAELYLRQGHEEDARRVYQALIAQRPQDGRLRARFEALLARITQGGAGGDSGGRGGGGGLGGKTGEALPAFLKRIIASHPAALGAASPPVAAEPSAAPEAPRSSAGQGSPLERAFALAPHEADAPTDGGLPGDPTRPAADTLSLDQVFGDEGLPGAPPAPEPAMPQPDLSAPAAPGAPAPGESGGFSFDQFFHGPAGSQASGTASGGSTPKGAARPSQPKALQPVEDEGDLDQFQAWLKGLKS